MKKTVKHLVSAVIALFAAQAFCYEMTFDGSAGKEFPAFRLVQQNSRSYVLDIVGSRVGFLLPVRGDVNRFRSRDDRFKGVLTNGIVRLEMRDKFGPVEAEFKDGHLVKFVRNGAGELLSYDQHMMRVRVPRTRDGRLMRFRPNAKNDAKLYWRGSGRLALWFDNPNEAGALLAVISILFIGLAFSVRRFWKVLPVLFALAAFVALIHTGSRGAVVALVAAVAVLTVCRFGRRMLKFRKLVLGGLVIAAVVAGLWLAFGEMRAMNGFLTLDRSNEYRLNAWLAAPKMMVAAPMGWWKEAGYCYADWFQDEADDHLLRWLVNGHLSVMTQVGWGLSLVYILLWTVLFAVLFREARRTGRSLALGAWVTVLVSMWFSTVGVSWTFWILPVLTLLPTGWWVVRTRAFGWKDFRNCGLMACGVLAVFLAIGVAMEMCSPAPFLVRKTAQGVKVGTGEVCRCVVDDNQVLSGGIPGGLGKELRRFVVENPQSGAILLANSLEDVPSGTETLIVTGDRVQDLLDLEKKGRLCADIKRIFLLSPPQAPADIPQSLREKYQIQIFIGELLADIQEGYENSPDWVTKFKGSAVYIKNWLQLTNIQK